MKKYFTLLALMVLGLVTANAVTIKYALAEGDTFKSGQTVEVKNGDEVVATITYGETGGADFKAAIKATNDGYTAMTEGNGENGNKTGGTFYTIVPKVDAHIAVAVCLNAGKAFYILEDGTALSDYNGITKAEKYYGTFEFDATADKAYKFYCSGSKLGFFGFEITPAENVSPEVKAAREQLQNVIDLAEAFAADELATQIAAAKAAVEGTDIAAMQTAMNTLAMAAIPLASGVLNDTKQFATTYGYTEVSAAVDATQAAILTTDMTKIQAALNDLIAKTVPAAQDAIGKIEGYAKTLNDKALNEALAKAKTSLASGNIKNIIADIKAIEEPFVAAAENFVAKVQAENIEDAAVQAALNEVAAAIADKEPNIVTIGNAVKELIAAYEAYQIAQRPEITFAENNVYYWESPSVVKVDGKEYPGFVTENGGTAVGTAADGRVNYPQAGYNTICLNGNPDFSTDIVTITLNEGVTLKKDDEIAITAFRNKNATGKTSGAKLKFDDGSTITTGDGKEFVNIHKDVATSDEYAAVPNTITIKVPETGDGSKKIVMTRSYGGTNLFITKIDISRPGETVGISQVNSEAAQNAGIFNLNGQRMMNVQKGLYIINGKKVLVK